MKPSLALVAAGVALSACGAPGFFPTPTGTSPPPTPTPTPVPLAAIVAGEGLLLSDLQEEVARFEAAQAALGIDLASLGDYRSQVLQALIDRRLLAQGAVERGLTFDEQAIDAELAALAEARGGSQAMGAWLAENGYTLESFKRALREDRFAAMMIERIASEVSGEAEQVRAAHILVATRAEAEELLAQLTAGGDFAELARVFSLDAATRPAGGDLGWFPRGYLLIPEVDQAAWSLATGETSEVVASGLGYHIVRSLERGVHPLAPDALRFVRQQAVEAWLEARRAATPIEITVAP